MLDGKIPKAIDFWFLPGFIGKPESFEKDKLVAVLTDF